MAHTKFKAEILSPEGEVWSGEVEQLSTRTDVGSIGILAGHQPLLAMLAPAELRLYESEDAVVRFAQGEGYLQVTADGALLLVEEAVTPGDLDRADIDEKLSKAREQFDATDKGTGEHAKAARDVRRWETFLAVLDGDGSSS
jgi:F-type H+-transporting ATPase subunit epsilon